MTGSRIIVVMLIAAAMFVTNAGAMAVAEDVTFIGSYDTGIASYVTVSGNYAYVIDDNNGLVILDVSDKETPVVTGSYDAVDDAYSVAISGNYAYVTDKHDGLVVLDVSDKEAPVRTGNYDVRGYARAVVVSGDYAYVADRSNGLVIVDVSDKEGPVFVGRYRATRNNPCLQEVITWMGGPWVLLCQATTRT
jgi:hypothetical protein